MTEPKPVPQKEFNSLDEFIRGQNNYYAHFLAGNPWGETRRRRPHFLKFQQQYPGLEEEVTRLTVEARRTNSPLPFEKLFETYPMMSQFVFDDDPGVRAYSSPMEYLLA